MRIRPRHVGAATLSLALGLTVLPVATGEATTAASRFVDTATPVFSHPSDITNPLFPVGARGQTVQLGTEGDVVLRNEITKLPGSTVVRWNGQDVETIASQFVAYGDGEIVEVAIDLFAQADDGSVWYFGEDVSNYDGGVVVDKIGSWLAGTDGPPGMIMPANPQVGDVYRSENIPGLVFETDTVLEVGLTVDGPTGPVPGAITIREDLLDGSTEFKVFAPGYGEFSADVPESDEHVAVAVATPTDSTDARSPRALDSVEDTATQLYRAADKRASRSTIARLAARAHRDAERLSASGEVPTLLDEQITGILDEMDAAVAARGRLDTKQAAVELGLAALDVELRFEDLSDVDSERIDQWRLQRRIHRAIPDLALAASDSVIIDAIEARIAR